MDQSDANRTAHQPHINHPPQSHLLPNLLPQASYRRRPLEKVLHQSASLTKQKQEAVTGEHELPQGRDSGGSFQNRSCGPGQDSRSREAQEGGPWEAARPYPRPQSSFSSDSPLDAVLDQDKEVSQGRRRQGPPQTQNPTLKRSRRASARNDRGNAAGKA